ncbi:ORF1629 [Spodoptera frugiperda granulovirus]|uniref:ORF1629 n=1 Tax=Spodoptera frugiperda granulovirus TaxID=307454 RepID=A0A0C5AS03_9BBAC|nr:ORF1629 [Spodoptera frugiperda granulovirus]AJK91664.1 ORF1629 [Spodoptera frugiperda granulovirus]
MDLLEFIRNTGFRADGRHAIMRMRRNHGLKKQLETNVQHVQLTVDECEEFLYTLVQMIEGHNVTAAFIPPPSPMPRSRRTSLMSIDQQIYEEDDKVVFIPPPPPPAPLTPPPAPPPPPPPPLVPEPTPTPPTPPPPKLTPADYLDDIKKGVSLKPVSRTAVLPAPPPPPQNFITAALRNKLNERREATAASSDDPTSEWSSG